VDFAGKTVLDIGCWDGQWSFLAENRGAARLLATDDCSQHWTSLGDRIGINQSPAPGLGFQLAKEGALSELRRRMCRIARRLNPRLRFPS
jgi:predicted nicotinamide N-methyase